MSYHLIGARDKALESRLSHVVWVRRISLLSLGQNFYRAMIDVNFVKPFARRILIVHASVLGIRSTSYSDESMTTAKLDSALSA